MPAIGMPIYQDAEILYTCVRTTFERIEANTPEALKGLLTAKLTLRFKCSQPTAEITLHGKERTFQAFYGPTKLRPDLDVELSGDTLHEILMETLFITKAIGNGRVKVKGPIWKMSSLGDLIHAGKAYYPDVLKEQKVI